jgi:carboxypeptidase Taq
MGQAKAAKLGTSVYDALLDQYEPDGRAAEIDPIFADLAAYLPGAIARAIEAQAKNPPAEPRARFRSSARGHSASR